jgi:hypothetical protein
MAAARDAVTTARGASEAASNGRSPTSRRNRAMIINSVAKVVGLGDTGVGDHHVQPVAGQPPNLLDHGGPTILAGEIGTHLGIAQIDPDHAVPSRARKFRNGKANTRGAAGDDRGSDALRGLRQCWLQTPFEEFAGETTLPLIQISL